ncbi:hypothetical protein HDU86_005167 [Geranomyces michiganensis]|nr:hypothetical protein HDU86_005167 [Geranomyces michiganensis]
MTANPVARRPVAGLHDDGDDDLPSPSVFLPSARRFSANRTPVRAAWDISPVRASGSNMLVDPSSSSSPPPSAELDSATTYDRKGKGPARHAAGQQRHLPPPFDEDAPLARVRREKRKTWSRASAAACDNESSASLGLTIPSSSSLALPTATTPKSHKPLRKKRATAPPMLGLSAVDAKRMPLREPTYEEGSVDIISIVSPTSPVSAGASSGINNTTTRAAAPAQSTIISDEARPPSQPRVQRQRRHAVRPFTPQEIIDLTTPNALGEMPVVSELDAVIIAESRRLHEANEARRARLRLTPEDTRPSSPLRVQRQRQPDRPFMPQEIIDLTSPNTHGEMPVVSDSDGANITQSRRLNKQRAAAASSSMSSSSGARRTLPNWSTANTARSATSADLPAANMHPQRLGERAARVLNTNRSIFSGAAGSSRDDVIQLDNETLVLEERALQVPRQRSPACRPPPGYVAEVVNLNTTFPRARATRDLRHRPPAVRPPAAPQNPSPRPLSDEEFARQLQEEEYGAVQPPNAASLLADVIRFNGGRIPGGHRLWPSNDEQRLQVILNAMLTLNGDGHAEEYMADGDLTYERLLAISARIGDARPPGLSIEQIDALPSQEYEPGSIPDDEAQCTICLTEYEAGENLRGAPCAHWFHSICLRKWLKESKTCPICRSSVAGRFGFRPCNATVKSATQDVGINTGNRGLFALNGQCGNFTTPTFIADNKWSKIKRLKGANDLQRARQTAKITGQIISSVKAGGGETDPAHNLYLASALQLARAHQLPKTTIETALKKALSGGGGKPGSEDDDLHAVVYEGLCPPGVALIIEALTDNKNRTFAEIRHAFKESGGSMTPVSYLFAKRGRIVFASPASTDAATAAASRRSLAEMEDDAIEAGVEDIALVDDSDDGSAAASAGNNKDRTTLEVYCSVKDVLGIMQRLKTAGYEMIEFGTVYVSEEKVLVPPDANGEPFGELLELLENRDDVVKVHHNAQ